MADENKLRSIISELTGHDISGIDSATDLVEAFAIDSIDGLRIIAGIERRMAITFPNETLGKLRSIDDLMKVINEVAS